MSLGIVAHWLDSRLHFRVTRRYDQGRFLLAKSIACSPAEGATLLGET